MIRCDRLHRIIRGCRGFESSHHGHHPRGRIRVRVSSTCQGARRKQGEGYWPSNPAMEGESGAVPAKFPERNHQPNQRVSGLPAEGIATVFWDADVKPWRITPVLNGALCQALELNASTRSRPSLFYLFQLSSPCAVNEGFKVASFTVASSQEL